MAPASAAAPACRRTPDSHHGPAGTDRSSAPRGAAASRYQRFKAFALAAALVASALTAPAQPASAEAPLGEPIPVGRRPNSVAIDPTTNRAYVANSESNSVSVIDTVTNTVVGTPIQLGSMPADVAINPTTKRLYVPSTLGYSVTVIDSETRTVIGSPIVVTFPTAVAVNPVTNRVYVACGDQVCVLDGATNTMIGNPIDAARGPVAIAVNPITNRIYVPSYIDHTVAVIDGGTNTVVGSPIPVQMNPYGVAVNPSTNRVYVANQGSASVSVIDGSTNTVVGFPVAVGRAPQGIAVDPVTNRIYVASVSSGSVTVIDGATGVPTDARLTIGVGPWGIAVNPATHRIYTANYYGDSVSVLHIPFALEAGTAPLGGSTTATWSSLFGPNGGDFIGLYEPSAPSTSPLSQVFTNGTAKPGGAGVSDGSASLPIPAGLATGAYEARLISGSTGVVYGRAAVTVAGPPTAVADSYTGGAAQTLTVTAPGVLANDADADSPTLQATVVTGPTFGTLSLQPNGAFSYVPAPGFAGTDGFTYRVADQTGLSSTATVTITVVAAPVTAADIYTVNHGSVLNVAAPGVLANDTDADSPALQASVVTDPANGTLSLQPNGAFSYTPRQGFAGTDRFTYRVTDQTGLSATGTATITVAPVACGPRPTVRTDSRVVDGALQVTVSTTGTDGPTNNRLKELRFATPVNGRVELAGQSHTEAFAYPVPAATDHVSFAVHRVAPGQATTAPLTVVDECGAWPTLVGGGTSAGF